MNYKVVKDNQKGEDRMVMQVAPSLNIKQSPNFNNIAPVQHFTKSEAKAEIPGLKKESPVPTKVKAGVFLTTLTGVSIVMASVLKKKGFLISNLTKTSPKNWGIFKVKYEEKEMAGLVTKLALGSVGGGLLGGALFDKKENMNAKYRESVIQLIGNIFTPLVCVFGGIKMYNKVKPQIVAFIDKSISKNETIKKIPEVLISAASLLAGIFLGNKVGNLINQKAFHIDDERKLILADMSPHIDDLAIATSLVIPQGFVGNCLSRVVPAALMIAGVSVGTTQEKPEHLVAKAIAEKTINNPNAVVVK